MPSTLQVGPDPAEEAVDLARQIGSVRALARLLDRAVRIPGTDIEVGLDAVIGLIPGFGDIAGAAMSGYIVWVAARLGAPKAVVARMLLNLGTDTVVGSIPLAGDLFDVAWKANARNVALLERHLAEPQAARRASWGVLSLAILGVVLLAIGAVALAGVVIRAIVGLF